MKEETKKVYGTMLRMASALDKLEKVQECIGESHDGTHDNPKASYDHVEQRITQPYDSTSEWFSRDPVMPKVDGADEMDQMPTHSAATGLNNRFMYPNRKKSASYIRKSSISRLKKAGIGY